MIRTVISVEASCDDCGAQFEDRDGCNAFDTLEVLARELAADGWLGSAQRVLCRGCIGRQACGLLDAHHWGPWEHIESPSYTGHYRHCFVCGLYGTSPEPYVAAEFTNPENNQEGNPTP